MKNLITILFSLNFLMAFGQQQDIDNNIIKYWNYRNRLINNFISIGDKPGQSLPFTTRNEKKYPALDHGQGPMILGQYLGVLASEFNLLKQQNSNTEQTLKELYFALYAFNRLDLVAETVNGYNKKAKLDGFFIREDFSNDFVAQNPSLNKNTNKITEFIFGSGKTFEVKCTTFKGDYRCGNRIDKNCKVFGKPKGYSAKYNHKPMSLDQFLGILIGVSLVNNLVGEDVNYQNKKFQDNETSIKKEAQNIAKRLISYAKKYNWTPKEPDGDYIGDCDFKSKKKPNYFQNNATMLIGARFISNIGYQIYGKKYGYPILLDALDGMGAMYSNFYNGDFYNLRMYIEMMTLSNKNNALFTPTYKRVKQISKIYNWEAFYYTLGQTLHNWKQDQNIIKKSLTMLNNAPYDGPFYHGINDYAKGGWASENRFSASTGEQYKGSRFPLLTGNYSGLDFMLLHNLHLLNHVSDNQKSNFGKLKNSKRDYVQKDIFLSKEICFKAEKKSCKERLNRHHFFYKLKQKNCKKSKSKCKKIAKKYISKLFDIKFNPKKKRCNNKLLKNKCYFSN